MDGMPHKVHEIAAKDAEAQVAELLRAARLRGHTVTILEEGEAVARILPEPAKAVDKDLADHRAFGAYLRSLPRIVVGPWTRDELYDD